MTKSVEITSKLKRTATALRSGSVKTVSVADAAATGRKVQLSWGSAMRR